MEPEVGGGVAALPVVFAGDWNELGYTGRLKNEAEALFFKRRLERNGGNVKRTAEELGMQRSHLYKKLDRYDLR